MVKLTRDLRAARPSVHQQAPAPNRGLTLLLRMTVAMLLVSGCNEGARLYESCSTVSDCNDAADGCFEVAFVAEDESADVGGAFCSRVCFDDFDCPRGACYQLDGASDFICYEQCTPALGCGAGLSCTEVEGTDFIDSICLPG